MNPGDGGICCVARPEAEVVASNLARCVPESGNVQAHDVVWVGVPSCAPQGIGHRNAGSRAVAHGRYRAMDSGDGLLLG